MQSKHWIWSILAVGILVALGTVALQRDQAGKARVAQEALQKQNEELQKKLQEVDAEAARLKSSLKPFEDVANRTFDGTNATKLAQLAEKLTQEPDVMIAPKPATAKPAAQKPPPTPREPEPEPNALVLRGTQVAAIDTGFVATMDFTPSKEGPLEMLALIVRVPNTGEAHITGLTPMDDSMLDDLRVRVDPGGKHAVLYATPNRTAPMQFAVSVDKPTTANISGTCGITPFDVDIGPAP